MRTPQSHALQLHLDLVGGLAGDMFVAALVDLAPDLEFGIQESLRCCGRMLEGVSCKIERRRDRLLAGRRFVVTREGEHGHGRRTEADHGHADWKSIRIGLEKSELTMSVKGRAIGIFSLLADAEARVHGCLADEVCFHEVGAWDSIADIVAAAHVIDASAAIHWTVGPVPLGSGRIETAHGVLPVPAPAAALLLEGFETVDDGVAGERVTPTGAAILRYLVRGDARTNAPRRLVGSGFGFGSRKLDGISNFVRVLQFEPIVGAQIAAGDVAVIEFEVDDQSAEDLALSLDRIRGAKGVHDVLQIPAFGKKGRMFTSIRILADPSDLDDVIAICFEETTTIGLRHRVEERKMLFRTIETVKVGEREVRVKIARRASGASAKAEADDLAQTSGRAAREALRRSAETEGIKEKP